MGTILVTGATGYIGSHTCVELLNSGHDVVGIDNLENSSIHALDRISELSRPPTFVEVDILDASAIDAVFREHRPDAVMHFAGLKAVGESVQVPLRYHRTNVLGTLRLLDAMQQHECTDLIFSSSCTVYGDPSQTPITEETPIAPINPYGRSKAFVEQILLDAMSANPELRTISLRYFNPVGAHESGRLGEQPMGVPNNLMPYVMQTAAGLRDEVQVFGGDYATPDGTCIRDYIHVVDLARAHIAALERMADLTDVRSLNVGTGSGRSVLEVIAAAEHAVGAPIPHRIVARRPGDAAEVIADTTVSERRLGWEATHSLADMASSQWNWRRQNPQGYT
jgi:UDP-glucose 4-epimerase